jgi:hypothetical protein
MSSAFKFVKYNLEEVFGIKYINAEYCIKTQMIMRDGDRLFDIWYLLVPVSPSTVLSIQRLSAEISNCCSLVPSASGVRALCL